ncbi:DUF4407 domain-containing protein [Ravibacter arvi]|uniref:DUF4407 domain-containing protein n=1 Tax=Ravibacter arvi TaxID=2051041 RepID=A0ABP8LSY9_9BACT
MKSFRDFFWFCSGVNRSILMRCPSESEKYAGIGATVFFTGVLASLSAGYALFTVFENIWIAAFFGLVWGMMIFNLDRYIVSSLVKTGKFWSEFKMVLPRLGLAVLLAVVISKPLELKIFEKEINRKLDVRKSEEMIRTREAIRKGLPEFAETEGKIAALKQEIADKTRFRDEKQQEYDFERFGTKTTGTTGIAGIGTNARKKEQQLNDAQRDLTETETRVHGQIAVLENQILELRKKEDQVVVQQKVSIDHYDGFAARIEALGALTAESNAMYLANIFLVLLFIAIEIAPIFVKFISSRGPYDELLEAHEQELKIYKEEKVAKNRQRSEARLLRFADEEKYQTEEKVSRAQRIRRKFAAAEDELLDETIQHWKEEEKDKLGRTSLRW